MIFNLVKSIVKIGKDIHRIDIGVNKKVGGIMKLK